LGYGYRMDQDLTTKRTHATPRNGLPPTMRLVVETVHGAPTEHEAFMDWLAAKPKEDGKYELSRGQVTRMQAWVRRCHFMVCTNIMAAFLKVLDRDRFNISTADFGVRTPDGTRFPDIMVEVAGGKMRERAALDPVFIAEVLSPSTTDVDFLEKAPEYMGIASMQTYIIVSPDAPCVWVYRRGPDGWSPKPERIIDDLAALIPLGGLDISLPVAEFYRGVVFADE
jgi:Uma2 family endonuclease